ncbi:MAG: hypothetical protein H0T89_03185 [Deltaproteobacteria bacterium]|nr:hypothetical protein [Deltaproteobacteria bacterium]
MVFDRTCAALSRAWQAGGLLYSALGRLDARQGVSSWPEALTWLSEVRAGQPVEEIQFWGHGDWGSIRVADSKLDVGALEPGHEWNPVLARIRDRMAGSDALWWFRTCETFGRAEGHEFARAWASFFNCRAAGHTYRIAAWQSGLHSLRPGDAPHWSIDEGVPEEPTPRKALWSSCGAPNTIHCLRGRIPPSY